MAKKKPASGKMGRAENSEEEFRPHLRRDQPREQTYFVGTHGQRGTGIPGNMCLKPGAPLYWTSPDFNVGHTVFRPLPMMSYTNPKKFSSAHILGPDGDPILSDFVRRMPIVKFWGVDKAYTFITHDPREMNYSWENNPALLLQKTIYGMIKDKTAPREWDLLTDGPKAPLKKMEMSALMQCILYCRGKEIYVGEKSQARGLHPDDQLPIICLSGGISERLVTAFNTEREIEGEQVNLQQGYKYGDVCGFTRGIFVDLWNPEQAGDKTDDWRAREKQRKASGKGGLQGYDMALHRKLQIDGRTYSKIVPALTDEEISVVKKKIQWFDDVLLIPSIEQVALWVAEGFGSLRYKGDSLLEFVWQEHEEFFTSDVKKVLKNAKQVAVGARPTADDEDDSRRASSSRGRQSGLIPDDETPVQEKTMKKGEAVTFTLKGEEVEGVILEILKADKKARVQTGDGTYKVPLEKLSVVEDDEDIEVEDDDIEEEEDEEEEEAVEDEEEEEEDDEEEEEEEEEEADEEEEEEEEDDDAEYEEYEEEEEEEDTPPAKTKKKVVAKKSATVPPKKKAKKKPADDDDEDAEAIAEAFEAADQRTAARSGKKKVVKKAASAPGKKKKVVKKK